MKPTKPNFLDGNYKIYVPSRSFNPAREEEMKARLRKHEKKYQILKNVSKFILVAIILVIFMANLTDKDLENSKTIFETTQILR